MTHTCPSPIFITPGTKLVRAVSLHSMPTSAWDVRPVSVHPRLALYVPSLNINPHDALLPAPPIVYYVVFDNPYLDMDDLKRSITNSAQFVMSNGDRIEEDNDTNTSYPHPSHMFELSDNQIHAMLFQDMAPDQQSTFLNEVVHGFEAQRHEAYRDWDADNFDMEIEIIARGEISSDSKKVNGLRPHMILTRFTFTDPHVAHCVAKRLHRFREPENALIIRSWNKDVELTCAYLIQVGGKIPHKIPVMKTSYKMPAYLDALMNEHIKKERRRPLEAEMKARLNEVNRTTLLDPSLRHRVEDPVEAHLKCVGEEYRSRILKNLLDERIKAIIKRTWLDKGVSPPSDVVSRLDMDRILARFNNETIQFERITGPYKDAVPEPEEMIIRSFPTWMENSGMATKRKKTSRTLKSVLPEGLRPDAPKHDMRYFGTKLEDYVIEYKKEDGTIGLQTMTRSVPRDKPLVQTSINQFFGKRTTPFPVIMDTGPPSQGAIKRAREEDIIEEIHINIDDDDEDNEIRAPSPSIYLEEDKVSESIDPHVIKPTINASIQLMAIPLLSGLPEIETMKNPVLLMPSHTGRNEPRIRAESETQIGFATTTNAEGFYQSHLYETPRRGMVPYHPYAIRHGSRYQLLDIAHAPVDYTSIEVKIGNVIPISWKVARSELEMKADAWFAARNPAFHTYYASYPWKTE